MAIFQPTNILPDLLSGTASGTVFYDPNNLVAPVTISWTVNGNSPLTAYKIDFYKNNAASTATDSTGKVTLSPAFSAISADGTETRFSCTVPTGYFVNAADSSGGYTGKFKITQWWGASDFVEQRSLTVFKVNGGSSVSATCSGYGGVYTFSAAFSAPNPDHFGTSVVWTRWRIFDSTTVTGSPVQDTGKVWGATSYDWTCVQLMPGQNYYAILTAETSMGEVIQSNWVSVSFGTGGNLVEITDAISAECDNRAKAIAVKVRYSTAIKGASSPDPDFDTYLDHNTGNVVLPAGASATWTIPSNLTYSKWGFAWHGDYLYNGTVISFTQSDGTVFDIHMVNGDAYVNPGNVYAASISPAVTNLYFFLTTGTGADADNWYLYVGSTLSGTYAYYRKQLTGFVQKQLSSINFQQNTTTMECRVVFGGQESLAVCAMTGADFDSTLEEPQLIVPYTQDQRYGEGGYAILEYFGPVMGYGSIYRSTNGGPLEFFSSMIPLPEGTMGVYYDYGVANGNQYKYYVIHQADQNTSPSMYLTDAVSPCWWEWTLIEAEPDGVYGTYKPVAAYNFRLNVSSGQDGNGSSPGVYSNFTPYPIVMRDTANRHSGTLTGLVGYISSPGTYEDRNDVRDAIRALSTTKNTLFLRSRRGDLFRVAVSGEITTYVEDNSPKQQVAASVPWVEIGAVDGSVVTAGTRSDDFFLTPEQVLAATAQMTPLQRLQMRANLNAADSTGLTERIKFAILDAAAHTAQTDDDGMTRFDALLAALYPEGGGS